MIQLFFALLIVTGVSVWWQLMQGRQKARKAAGLVCTSHDLQLLDDTVSLSSITWDRSDAHTRFLVSYHFEFATDGARRRSGVVQITSQSSLNVTLEMEGGRLIEEITSLDER